MYRGTVKTYTRQRALLQSSHDFQRPHKRIRMAESGSIIEDKFGEYTEDCAASEGNPCEDAPSPPKVHSKISTSSSVSAPSSPLSASRAIFSSDVVEEDESELSSAPSSPPSLPSPVPAARKPAFSFLKRKRSTLDDGSAGDPLSDIAHNARKIPRLGKKGLTQMQIDLGGEVRKTCRICDMEYIPSVKEDAALHSKFCAMNVGGVDLGKAFLRDDTVKKVHSGRARGNEREMVVTVDRKSSLAARNGAKKILGVVNAELSSATLDDDELWGSLCPEEQDVQPRKETRKGTNRRVEGRGDRFKAFLYMVGDRCVGFCLAEKISNAFPVAQPQPGDDRKVDIMAASRSSSISVKTTTDVALLGISRIWTSRSHRSRGIATELLECARSNFFYGVASPKNLVAFSQPTESGGRLAERWFGAKEGWHVYRGK